MNETTTASHINAYSLPQFFEKVAIGYWENEEDAGGDSQIRKARVERLRFMIQHHNLIPEFMRMSNN